MPLKHRGVATHISCDNQEIEHYQREVVGDDTVQCYIPSEAGKEISISVQDCEVMCSICATVSLDGHIIRHAFVKAGTGGTLREVHTSPSTSCRIQFANLKLQDKDEDDLFHAPCLEKIGTIEIMIQRVIPVPAKQVTVNKGVVLPDVGPVSERSKKVGWHRTTLTAEKKAAPLHNIPVAYLDTVDQPYARFIFRYLPKALLQARGIMPRPHFLEIINNPQPLACARNSRSQKAKKRSSLSQKSDERMLKRRALEQESLSSSRAREGSSALQGSRIKQDDVPVDPDQAEAIRTLQKSIQAARDTMLAAQAQLDRLENRQVKIERVPSPIRVGVACDEIIDLTLDD